MSAQSFEVLADLVQTQQHFGLALIIQSPLDTPTIIPRLKSLDGAKKKQPKPNNFKFEIFFFSFTNFFPLKNDIQYS